MESMPTAVALLSGGLDSAMAMRLAQESGVQVCLALTFDYGQRASGPEYESAHKLAESFGIPHRVIPLPWFRSLTSQSQLLKDNSQLPEPNLAQLDDSGFSQKSAQAVWVPNRNGIFIEIAAGFAESMGCDHVIVGFNKEEAETFPDNSQAYLEEVSKALSYSTASGVKVHSLTAQMTKTEIVKKAKEIDFPLELLWSCYQNGARMCGQCESCMRLKRAFHQNNIKLDTYFANPSL